MEWVRYWRDAQRPLEAMHAHFVRHTYHRHSHDAYSFGVTDAGAQAFTCRGGRHTSAAGMVMAFNPDDPHDGRSAAESFTYRIVHIGPDLVANVLADIAGRRAPLPLFDEPVVHDEGLAMALRGLHQALSGSALERDERLTAVVAAMVARTATRSLRAHDRIGPAHMVREAIEERYAADLTADDLAAIAGTSRFAVYRSFRRAYGMAPSDYQRQVRLRAARRRLAAGKPPAEVAADVGFADQSHLNRWFVRYYGITPGVYLSQSAATFSARRSSSAPGSAMQRAGSGSMSVSAYAAENPAEFS